MMTGNFVSAIDQNSVLRQSPTVDPQLSQAPAPKTKHHQDPMTESDDGIQSDEVDDQIAEEQDDQPIVPAVRPNLQRSRELAIAAATTAQENGGFEIVVLDMTGLTSIFDYFVVASGTSQRQLVAMSEEIRLKLEKDLKDRRISLDGQESGKWIVLDFGSVVIHLFDEDTRQFYSLEALWGDARNVTAEFGLTAVK